jgi:hypothetical protein
MTAQRREEGEGVEAGRQALEVDGSVNGDAGKQAVTVRDRSGVRIDVDHNQVGSPAGDADAPGRGA